MGEGRCPATGATFRRVVERRVVERNLDLSVRRANSPEPAPTAHPTPPAASSTRPSPPPLTTSFSRPWQCSRTRQVERRRIPDLTQRRQRRCVRSVATTWCHRGATCVPTLAYARRRRAALETPARGRRRCHNGGASRRSGLSEYRVPVGRNAHSSSGGFAELGRRCRRNARLLPRSQFRPAGITCGRRPGGRQVDQAAPLVP
jgi:hypothetical protein